MMSSHPQRQPATQHYHQPRGGSTGAAGSEPEVVRIGLLGGFRLWVGPRLIEDDRWRLRKARSLVKLLALSPDHRLQREEAMDLLWPDSGRKATSNNLRYTLHATRRILDPTVGSRYLASEDGSLVLCPGGSLWVDVQAFEEAAATARRSRDPAAYRAAIELYAGDLLPEDRYEEWAEDRREQLQRLYLDLLVELARLYEERGEYELAIEALRKATAEEPTLEQAHVDLMRAYVLLGRPEQALSQYERLRDALFRGLGTQPAATTRRLRDEIATGRLPSAPPAGPPQEELLVPGQHNLPATRTNFVGREREMVEVKRTLSMTRLLTLTGAGGSGKTRLALEVARDLIGTYPDGVWLVELAPLSEGDLVAQEVAGTLEVPERPGEPLIDTLVDALGGKGLLLVLDNCEHLVEAAAQLVDALLDSCPRLSVLATSREPLGLGGEVLLQVPTLSLPSADRAAAIEGLIRYEAVRLFVDRARLRLPDFGLTQDNAEAVARVCQKLDSMPLAIELATARMGALAVEQVAQRLEASLDLLRGTSRSVEARHQTLRATLDWSYDLLSEAEQAVFGRLPVFAGGWTLEAAEAVCSGGVIEQDHILDVVGRLVDKSLVVAGASRGGAVRYRMLEPIRQYARERLVQTGASEEVKRLHAEYFLALAEEAEPQLWGPEEVEWLEHLEAEHDNLRAALSWALEGGMSELSLRLAGALWKFWDVRGYYGEGLAWLKRVLARGSRVSAARVKALEGEGRLSFDLGELDEAGIAAREGLKLSDEAGLGGAVRAKFLDILGWIAIFERDQDRVKELFEESLSVYREAGDMRGIAWSLQSLANAAGLQGDYERVKKLYQESLALCRKLGGTHPLTDCLHTLGYYLLLEGDYERGEALNEEAAALLRGHGHTGFLQYPLDNLGWAKLLQGDHERARGYYEQSIVLCKELGDKMIASESMEGLACVAADRGEPERAARLFGAGEGLREALGFHHVPFFEALREPYLAAARSRLDEEVWESAWAEGRAMTLEEAVKYALAKEAEPPVPTLPELGVPSVDQPHVGLTPREKEVALLVAREFTNRQIASKLMLSELTVATHVRNILRKLGLYSRNQIAAYFTEQHKPLS